MSHLRQSRRHPVSDHSGQHSGSWPDPERVPGTLSAPWWDTVSGILVWWKYALKREGGQAISSKIDKVPIHLKTTLTIREAAEYSNIGINKIDSMLRTPNCPFVLYVGTKKLVKRKEFERYIAEKLAIWSYFAIEKRLPSCYNVHCCMGLFSRSRKGVLNG